MISKELQENKNLKKLNESLRHQVKALDNFTVELENAKNEAYRQRNEIALHFSDFWYRHDDPDFEGWQRVIGWWDGDKAVTFHVPDDFDLGDLEEVPATPYFYTDDEKWEALRIPRRGVNDVLSNP